MSLGRTPATLGLALALGASDGAAQLSGTVDAGWSYVTYDDFLPSHAGSATLGLRYENPSLTLGGRGTVLRFQSGRGSIGGSVFGSYFTRSFQAIRGELSGSVGGSRYDSLARYGHALGRVRLHASSARQGGWLDATAGNKYVGGFPTAVLVAGGGWWTRRARATVTASLARVHVGDTVYADGEVAVRYPFRRIDLDLSSGIRLASRGGGEGVFGEGALTFWLTDRLALGASAGRYPSDPVHGNIAGRYIAFGMHLGSRGTRPELVDPRERLRDRALPRPAGYAQPVALTLELAGARAGWRTFILHAPGARSVELMGDFTDWVPVVLGRAGATTWQVTLPVSAGLHRINVRLNGGTWTVPAGLATAPDDFGGHVGLIVID